MKRFYFSQIRVKECLRAFLKDVISNQDPIKLLTHIDFLNIQKAGSSQKIMLNIINDILLQEYGFTLTMTGTEKIQTYIYVDDGIYTGNKLRYDLTNGADSIGWLSNCPSSGCTLWIYTIAGHTAGIDYVKNILLDAAQAKQIKIQRKTTLMINNTRNPSSDIEILWPENIYGEPYVDDYVSDLQVSSGQKSANNIFRQSRIPSQEKLFSSPEARVVVEKAFLRKGIQIAKASKKPAPSMRPLGFMKLVSLGFGTFFVTYRNIANNCPLVLWWGDPDLYPSTHPIGMWYPLLPRRRNNVVS